jgi:hypothetical protein
MSLPVKGDFSFVEDKDIRKSMEIAYESITELSFWDWLSTYRPPHNSFMYDINPYVVAIEERLTQKGEVHSGASFALVMNAMQYIARHGWDKWIKLCTSATYDE